MGVYFYADVYVWAAKSEDLDELTNEKLLELALQPGRSPDEGEEWLVQAKRERSGKIDERLPLFMRIHAGGTRFYCLSTTQLSQLFPKLIFLTCAGADCNDMEELYFSKNGKMSKCISTNKRMVPDGPNGFEEFKLATYEQINSLFEKFNITINKETLIPIDKDSEIYFINEEDE